MGAVVVGAGVTGDTDGTRLIEGIGVPTISPMASLV